VRDPGKLAFPPTSAIEKGSSEINAAFRVHYGCWRPTKGTLHGPFTHDLIIAARKRANYSRALFPDAFRAAERSLPSSAEGNNCPSLGKRMLAEQNGHSIVHAPVHARVWEIFDFSERQFPARIPLLGKTTIVNLINVVGNSLPLFENKKLIHTFGIIDNFKVRRMNIVT